MYGRRWRGARVLALRRLGSRTCQTWQHRSMCMQAAARRLRQRQGGRRWLQRRPYLSMQLLGRRDLRPRSSSRAPDRNRCSPVPSQQRTASRCPLTQTILAPHLRTARQQSRRSLLQQRTAGGRQRWQPGADALSRWLQTGRPAVALVCAAPAAAGAGAEAGAQAEVWLLLGCARAESSPAGRAVCPPRTASSCIPFALC